MNGKNKSTGRRSTANGAKKYSNRDRGQDTRREVEDTESRSKCRGGKRGSTPNNDVSWYAANPQLLVDAASVAYSYPIGMKMDMGPIKETATGESIPGVMTFPFISRPGVANDPTSAVNLAARNIYSYVRHANSGHYNYNSPDLMMYLLAMDSIYTIFAHLVRIYGVARTYSSMNRYYPDALLANMGADPEDVRNNLANLRYGINQLVTKIGQFCVPDSMPYMTRHMWLCSNIYTDGEPPKCQSYLFVPKGYYVFKPTKYETGGALEYKEFFSWTNLGKVSELLDVLDEMISAIVVSEDMAIMSGDILKAFGADKVIRLPALNEDYTIIPGFNPEVMMQINNIVATGEAVDRTTSEEWGFSSLDIYQENDNIYAPLAFDSDIPWAQQNHLLNMPMTFPNAADTMVGTRLTVLGEYEETDSNDTYYYIVPRSIGSEYVPYFTVTIYGGEGEAWSIKHASFKTVGDTATDKITSHIGLSYASTNAMNNAVAILATCNMLTKFANHPRVNTYLTASIVDRASSTVPLVDWQRVTSAGDTQTVAILQEHTLTKMHECALLSQFNVPLMGAWAQKVK